MATTKTKKVETPIDERETFVSLQKNFADSELSVEEKLKTLYQLQLADNEIEQLVQFRGELPAEVAGLEDEVAALEAKKAHFEEMIEEYENSIKSAKQQMEELDAEIEKYSKQKDNSANSREYGSIEKEIENLGLLHQIAEKNIGEAKMAIAERKDAIDALCDKLAIKNADLDAKKEELATIVESTSAKEAELRAKRDACAEKIDARTMSAYDRIRASVHNHLAVVGVYNGDSCGGCFNTVTPQRLVDIASGKKLVICEHCGRILVNTEI